MFAATRSRCGGLALLIALLCACAAAPALGAVPGGYSVLDIDGPTPRPDRAFGAVMANAGDLDHDFVDDVVIGDPGADGGVGEVVAVSGFDGSTIYRIAGPGEPAAGGNPLAFGSAVAPLGDVLQCSENDQAGDDCSNKQLSADGRPEFLVGAAGGDVSAPGTGVDQGRVYVIDGSTGAIASRVMLAFDDLPPAGKAEFGFSVLSPGDITGGDGLPDVVVGAPGYSESDSTYCPGAVCTRAGRVYVYSAADLGGQSTSPLQSPITLIDNPFASDDPQSSRFGHSLTPLTDIGSCPNRVGGDRRCLNEDGQENIPSNQVDGEPEFLVSAPLQDQGAIPDAGAAYVMDGDKAVVIRKVDAVDPQPNGHFGDYTYNAPPAPDMGASAYADLVIGAPGHDRGRAFVIDGDVLSGGLLTALSDPAPVDGGRFGAAASGIFSGGVAVGAPFGARIGTVRIFGSDRALAQTICDPGGQLGSEFGASIATIGDLSGDGFDELVIGAPGFDHAAGADSGRVYLLTSKGPAATGSPGGCVPLGPGGGGGGGDGGGGGGGGDEVTPPDEGEVVIARVLRRLVLKPNHKRLRKNAALRLRGTLTASARRSVCQNRQKIALQRRRAGGRFKTFDVAVTRATGKFTARAVVERTYTYRARVSQTARCMGATSKTARVSVLRKRGSR